MNRIAFLRSLTAAAVVLAAGAAFAEDAPIKLSRTYKPKAEIRYHADIKASVSGTDVEVAQESREIIQEVKPNGDAVIVHADEGSKMTLNGAVQEQAAGPPVVETRDHVGKLVGYKAPERAQAVFTPEVERLMAVLSSTILTDKSVKAGDTWATELDNPILKGKKATVKGTFVGIETVEGMAYWKVKQHAEAATDTQTGKVVYDYTAWLDPADGHLTRMQGTVTGIPTTFGNMDFALKMKQVPLAVPAGGGTPPPLPAVDPKPAAP